MGRLFILLTVVLPIAAFGKSVCKPEPLSNPLVAGRSSSVKFPDGRVISVVGHIHGKRQIYEIIAKIDSGELASMSDIDFNQMLRTIQRSNRETYGGMITQENRRRLIDQIQAQYGVDVSHIFRAEKGLPLTHPTVESHADQDRRFIQQLLKSGNPNRPEFFGFEGTYETWHENFPHFLRAKREFLRQFNLRAARGNIDFTKDEVEKLLLGASNANVYAYMENPSLQREIPVLGTESSVAADESQTQNSLGRMYAALQQVIAADDAYWETKDEAAKKRFKTDPSKIAYFALLVHVYSETESMNIESYDELERYVSELSAKAFPWIKSEIESLIELLRLRVRINFARDQASALNLVSQYRSGVHFVGLNHYRHTVASLVQLCIAERDGITTNMDHPQKAVR